MIAPPYDVVSTAEARALGAQRPLSFLHISRPEIDLPDGTDPYVDAVYARGAENLSRLIAEGVLARDTSPALYAYRMHTRLHTQTGVAFTASVRAYEDGRVRRHELTRPEKENDRVRHIAALNAQTGPVLCAYRAQTAIAELLRRATATPALLEATGPNDVLHTVWRVDRPADVRDLTQALDRLAALYIADGHHRAAAAARVAGQRRQDADPRTSHEHFLVVAFPHDELRILDYNRVVRDLNGLTPAGLIERVEQAFAVQRSGGQLAPAEPGTFGMYLARQWYRLTVPAGSVPRSDPVASLDVSLLQDRLIGPLLGITDPRSDARIDFVGGVRGLSELERLVDSGAAAVAFSLCPTRMLELMAVADAGRLMPPKSTWFEPKLADGLLSHVLD